MRVELSASRAMVRLSIGFMLLIAAALPIIEIILLPISLYAAALAFLWLSFKQVFLVPEGFVVVSRRREEHVPFAAVRSVRGGSPFGLPHITLSLGPSHGNRRVRFLPEPSQGNILGGHSKLRRQLQELISHG